MFEYYSNVDINRAIRSGELRFHPAIDDNQLGTASVDLQIKAVKEVDVDAEDIERFKKLKGELYFWGENYEYLSESRSKLVNILKLRKLARIKKHLMSFDRQSKLTHPKSSSNGQFWYLDASKIYVSEYKVRISLPKDVQIELSRKSDMARRGLDSVGWFYESGTLKEIFLPLVDIRIYTDSYVSQLSFRRKSDETEALIEELIKSRQTSIKRDGEFIEPSILTDIVGYELTLNPKVFLFRGRMIDSKSLDKDGYVSFDSRPDKDGRSKPIFDEYSFMLGQAIESVRVGPNFVGMVHPFIYKYDLSLGLLSHYLESNINAPYVWPLSINKPVFEIPGDRRYIFNGATFNLGSMISFLEMNRVKTPSVEAARLPVHRYSNRILPI